MNSSNMYRQLANRREEIANNWLAFAKNKKHSKSLRIKAAARYRENMKAAADYREKSKQ